MRRRLLGLVMIAGAAWAQNTPAAAGDRPIAAQAPVTSSLLGIKRVYVEALSGDGSAEAIRQLIIASLQQSRLFVVTDNPDRADATVRGAANDTAFTDTFDSQDGINARSQTGVTSGRTSSTGVTGRATSALGGLSVGEDDAQHTRERKHEAYATVRLCNRDGDVLWATTQESHGAKFRGASADVAGKVMKQMQLDFAKAAHERSPVGPASSGAEPESAKPSQ